MTKKICFLDSYYTGLNGAPKSMLSLAKGIYERSFDVTIFTTKNDLLLQKANNLNLNTDFINTPQTLLKSRKNKNIFFKFSYVIHLFYFWFLLLIKKHNYFNKYDVICINDIRSFLLFLPLLIINKKKLIWYIRINERIKFITKTALILSKKVILISRDSFSVFNENEIKKYSDKFSIINTGFNFPLLKEQNISSSNLYNSLQIEKNDVVFISIGSICERKNQLSIINTFKKLNIDNKKLILIGSPTSDVDRQYEVLLNKEILKQELSENIIKIPYCENIFDYLKLSHIFLFASRKEGLPRVLIEALSTGCYLCSSNVDGVNDIIDNEKIGLKTDVSSYDIYFEDNFLNLINKALSHYSKDKEFRMKYVRDKFNYTTFINNFIKTISV